MALIFSARKEGVLIALRLDIGIVLHILFVGFGIENDIGH